MNEELIQNLSKALKGFSDRRVVSQEELDSVITAIVAVLSANKKAVESLNEETKTQLKEVLDYVDNEHSQIIASIRGDFTKTKQDIETAIKDQTDRAFRRLQEVIAKIKIPKDGKDGVEGPQGPAGKDGSPDTPVQVRDKLETLKDDDRLDASAIKNLPEFIKQKGKELVVGGIRFLENLVDVAITPSKKRQDVLIQYDNTNKRWQDGVALTVSTTQPTSPQEGDIWLDVS